MHANVVTYIACTTGNGKSALISHWFAAIYHQIWANEGMSAVLVDMIVSMLLLYIRCFESGFYDVNRSLGK